MTAEIFEESPAAILVDGKRWHFLCANTRPFFFLPGSSLWICGTIRGESHAEFAFRVNQSVKRNGFPADARWSQPFTTELEILPAGKGIDFDAWFSGRVWLDAGVVNFWEEPCAAGVTQQILRSLHQRPEAFRFQ